MNHSPQQDAVIKHLHMPGSGSLIVEARAGSGKTTTILEAAFQAQDPTILLCAFNRRIADELTARLSQRPLRRGRMIKAQTLHSIGLEIVRQAQPVELDRDATDHLVKEVFPSASFGIRRAIVKTVRYLKETCWDWKDLPGLVSLIGSLGYTDALPGTASIEVALGVQETMRASLAVRPTLDFCDMIWRPHALNLSPRGRYRTVIVDEAQDMSLGQFFLIERMVAPGGRLVAVGDLRQCHPAGVLVKTTSGLVSIEALRPGIDKIIPWNRNAQRMVGSSSFSIAKRPYRGRIITMHVAQRSVPMTPNHRVLCRWHDRSTSVWVTYLMYRSDLGYRIGWCQLFDNKNCFHLAIRARIEKADQVWILGVHASKVDAGIAESVLAAKHGLFTATFEPVHQGGRQDAASIRSIFAGVPIAEQQHRAEICLVVHGRDLQLPFLPWIDGTRRGRYTYFPTYASNLIPGLMAVPVQDGPNDWRAINHLSVSTIDGFVYSLDVTKEHTYSANGVIVLNCIYNWRGAAGPQIWNMLRGEKYKAKTLPLTYSFRCPIKVINEAKAIVADIDAAPGAVEGIVDTMPFSQAVREIAIGDFFLSRTNAGAVTNAIRAHLRRASVRVLGGYEELGPLLDLIKRMNLSSQEAFIKDLGEWFTKESAKENRTQEQADRTEDRYTLLAEASKLVEPKRLSTILKEVFRDDSTPAALFSTVHKAKGLEADRVFLLRNTFSLHQLRRDGSRKRLEDVPIEEQNIEYVAITRAIRHLTWVLDDRELRE